VPGPRFLMRHHTGQAVQDAPQEPLDIVPIDPKSPHRVLFPNYRIDFCRRGDISHAPACRRSSLHVGLALLPLNCVASRAGRKFSRTLSPLCLPRTASPGHAGGAICPEIDKLTGGTEVRPAHAMDSTAQTFVRRSTPPSSASAPSEQGVRSCSM
jgi:hypothetical protein